ncbi:MAG TPA: hypothetical protein QF800_00980 [Phycisphaerales bacterium]|nr:hypothetical protein [Phycisphaerales bacterium]
MSSTSTRWCVDDIADAIAVGLQDRVDADRAAQAVKGVDALDEVSLHPLLATSLESAGFGVHREQRYIEHRRRRSRAQGRRCDVVLTPDARPLQDPQAAATLFEDPEAVPLSEAFWLEVKTVSQFTEMGPNAAWSNELLGTVKQDVAKLAGDAGILHAGLLIVLWTADLETATHDLGIWQDRCLSRGLPIAAPSQRHFPIQNRLGNAFCVMHLYPVHHL